jgi:hypothetical protein
MGPLNWIVTVFVSPLTLQVAFAELIVTADGPAIIKSDPLGAIELHRIGSGKLRLIETGVQAFGATIVLIGMAGCGRMVKEALLLVGIARPQLSVSVFPSVPIAAFNV